MLDSPRTGLFLFEGFLKRLRQISSKDNSPGVDTGDFTDEGYLTRGCLLPLAAAHPWDWLGRTQSWSTGGTRPIGARIPSLLAPCSGAIWLGPLGELTDPAALPTPSRGQFAAFSATEFGGLYGAGGIGSLTQSLLGERIQCSLKPNRVVVVASDDTLTKLAERYGTTVATLGNLNPNLTQRPSDWLPAGSWLFIPRRRAAANSNADGSYVMPEIFYTPETLAAYLGVSTSTIYIWNTSGYGPAFINLGTLVRYPKEDDNSLTAGDSVMPPLQVIHAKPLDHLGM